MPDVVIVGAGQAGLAASACLSQHGIDHVVLEKYEIGASWRRQRWNSFCLVTPNWTVRLPGQSYEGPDPDGFMPGSAFVSFLENYADSRALPVKGQTEVTSARPADSGWQVETSAGVLHAKALIVATSTYQSPTVPAFARELDSRIGSLSASDYRTPEKLPPGRVLVVGSAQSGGQIVEDLLIGGREVLATLPTKTEALVYVPMSKTQVELSRQLLLSGAEVLKSLAETTAEGKAEMAAAEKGGAVAGRDERIAERVERGVVAVRQSSDNVRRAAHDAPHAARDESPRRRLRGGERDGNERGVSRNHLHLLIDEQIGRAHV